MVNKTGRDVKKMAKILREEYGIEAIEVARIPVPDAEVICEPKDISEVNYKIGRKKTCFKVPRTIGQPQKGFSLVRKSRKVK